MMKLFIPILFLAFIGSLRAEEVKFWHEGRITPEQPFKAKVIGIRHGWGWDTLILREEGEGRYCLATFGNPLGEYKTVEIKDFDQAAMIKSGAIFLTPGIEVSRFSWSMSIWKHGKIFGEEDSARRHLKKSTKPENKSE